MDKNLERAKRIVATWPEWKRNITLTKFDAKISEIKDQRKKKAEAEMTARLFY